MTQSDGGYDIKPEDKPPAPPPAPKPGEPGWVPPVPIIEKADPEPSPDEPPPDPDAEQHKGIAILAYICFILPLLLAPKSKFARFHANQGLLTFIFWCVAILANIALVIIHSLMETYLAPKVAVLYGFFTCVFYLLEPALLVAGLALTIYGIIQAANGEKTQLPLFGKITLIK